MRRRAAPAASRSSCCTAGRTPGSRSAASCPFCRETSTCSCRTSGASVTRIVQPAVTGFPSSRPMRSRSRCPCHRTRHHRRSLVRQSRCTLCRAQLPRTRRAGRLDRHRRRGSECRDTRSARLARRSSRSGLGRIRAGLSVRHGVRAVAADFFDRIVAESLKLPAELWRQVFDGILAYDDTATWRG